MTSRTERFERKAKETPDARSNLAEDEEIVRFPPEEEAALLKESNEIKGQANSAFALGNYKDAIELYNQALNTCPRYLGYERAVLKSNVAACHLKTEEWKEAMKAAGECLELLDSAEGKEKEKKKNKKEKSKSDPGSESGDEDDVNDALRAEEEQEEEEEEADEEIITPGAARAEDTSVRAKRKADINRIRTKALMRRGKARMEIGSWSSLQGAGEDYTQLSGMSDLSSTDKKVVQKALAVLPARTKAAQEKEMGEMMGKLKDLGNGILRPFGLSTDNFKMVKDEKTGGYSMNFNQGAK